MKLTQVLEGVNYFNQAETLNHDITGLAYDSRKVEPGFLFVCISGFKTDGHLYAGQAIEKGAVVILAEKDPGGLPSGATLILCPDTRQALAQVAANLYGHPTRSFRLIGVTGTNGKTTTTHLVQAILEEAGNKTGIMGTLYAKIGETSMELGHTTPEAPDIEAFMHLCRENRADYVVMEVSSHALSLNRVAELNFNVAVFTNLTQDHLDFHRDMIDYRDAKLKLFEGLEHQAGNYSIINADDTYAADMVRAAGPDTSTFGIKQPAAITARDLQVSQQGSRFTVVWEGGSFVVQMQLIGLFSVYNALAAIALALREEIPVNIIISALQKVDGVPGRFEQVQCGQNFTVVVDYAHTPDGLENILKTARELTDKRLITVFGCGGDRDRKKRPLMGGIAAHYSDFSIVTSDNPRSEDPQAIINEIIPGLEKVENSRYAIIVDRREAIRHAIFLAREGDLVVIAGKGHETYQLVQGQVLDFDDRKVAAEFLKGTD
ncbi:MAG TPA: UDP-N-acetylmuramoyl-L-alanyl-D-glutamate--2,6-diaminopimelate ligase [Syntrophomonadaceae bacterium]|nr:UDP-N-acetylmuramoyl-L-alanyl-D-glutamate--2,6-diaminopimelate ligase [Syntrophomonadaceae bacterium]